MFKKIILSIFMFSILIQQCAFAETIGPFNSDSQFAQENLNQIQSDKDKQTVSIMQKMRYATAISFYALNNYVRLIGIETKPGTPTEEVTKMRISTLSSLGYDPSFSSLTHKYSVAYLLVLWHQQNNEQSINTKIRNFSESQKNQYIATTYNMKIASNINKEAAFEFQNAIIDQGVQNNNNIKKILSAMRFNADATEALYNKMLFAGKTNNLNMIIPSNNANVLKSSINLQEPEKSIDITSKATVDMETIVKQQEISILKSFTNNKNAQMIALIETTNIYESQKNYSAAIKAYNELLLMEPTMPMIWYGRAMSKWNMGDTQGFLADYNKALALGCKPDVNTIYIKSIAETMLGQYDKASKDFLTTYNLAVKDPTRSAIAGFSWTYRNGLLNGGGETLKKKFLIENPLHLKTSMSKGGTFETNNNTSVQEANLIIQPKFQMPPNVKKECPPGSKAFLIVGRLKGSGTEVRYATKAPVTKINDIIQADSRFETVHYISIPESEFYKYPQY